MILVNRSESFIEQLSLEGIPCGNFWGSQVSNLLFH